MDLQESVDTALRPELGDPYKKAPQKVRAVTEDWGERELYCPACPNDHLNRYQNNRAVRDFRCSKCDEDYQLKAKKGKIGSTISNSAYAKKMEAIQNGTVPNYVFISYDETMSRVLQGFLVPGHFVTPSIVARRNPLRETARRKGWVGSNLLLKFLPPEARITIIEDKRPRPVEEVRKSWSRFQFLQDRPPENRSWIADVLAVVRELETTKFQTEDVYAFENRLSKLHPENRHIRPKIRQQLQVLRDRGIVRFVGRGIYELIEA